MQWDLYPIFFKGTAVVPPFVAGKNLLPIRNRAIAVTQQDE
jgi:hypothetical protein